jgi:hypothetical protein
VLKAFATAAKAKLVQNKKLGTVRLVVAFTVTETNKNGNYKFPVHKKCDYVSGDLLVEDILTELQRAKSVLRTDNIVVVS